MFGETPLDRLVTAERSIFLRQLGVLSPRDLKLSDFE